MKNKIPIGYYIYLIIVIILFFIFWVHFNNRWYESLIGSIFLGVPITYGIAVIHCLIEKMK